LNQSRKIVLASASPRRRELLTKIGLNFIIDPSDCPENLERDLDPVELAQVVSLEKAQAVASKHPDAIIIAADTIGILRGKIIGKPHTAEEAIRMLKTLSGRSHRVVTGITVIDTNNHQTITRAVETRVHLKRLSDTEIKNYVKSGEPLDKAGAYAIQGLGSVLVEKIDGDYYNVVGLPLNSLAEALKRFGANIL
jgi:septum formation protein